MLRPSEPPSRSLPSFQSVIFQSLTAGSAPRARPPRPPPPFPGRRRPWRPRPPAPAWRGLSGPAAGCTSPACRPAGRRRSALPCPAVVFPAVDDAEGAGDDAVAAAVADVGLHVDGVELGPDDGPRGAGLQAAGPVAVLADIRHQQPGEIPQSRLLAGERHRPFDERDVPPGRGPEGGRVVVRHAGEEQAVVRELVPLLAGDLAGLAADADRAVREEADGHLRSPRPVACGRRRGHAGPWASVPRRAGPCRLP